MFGIYLMQKKKNLKIMAENLLNLFLEKISIVIWLGICELNLEGFSNMNKFNNGFLT